MSAAGSSAGAIAAAEATATFDLVLPIIISRQDGIMLAREIAGRAMRPATRWC